MWNHTQKVKDKIRNYHLGRKLSSETKQKIREKRKLQKPTFLGKRHSDEAKQKMRIAKLGRKLSEEHKTKIGIASRSWQTDPNNKEKRELAHKKIADKLRGKPKPWNWQSNSHLWKGGLTSLKNSLRKCFKYVEWRSFVYKRDKFTCQHCGDYSGGNLHAHHIKPFYKICDENNVETYEQGIDCAELWDANNGITLCNKCHELTDTFGRRSYTKKVLI